MCIFLGYASNKKSTNVLIQRKKNHVSMDVVFFRKTTIFYLKFSSQSYVENNFREISKLLSSVSHLDMSIPSPSKSSIEISHSREKILQIGSTGEIPVLKVSY